MCRVLAVAAWVNNRLKLTVVRGEKLSVDSRLLRSLKPHSLGQPLTIIFSTEILQRSDLVPGSDQTELAADGHQVRVFGGAQVQHRGGGLRHLVRQKGRRGFDGVVGFHLH